MITISCCKHYDKIVNFLYLENDTISKLLINYYQEYVFNVKSEKSKIKIDNIMNLYTDKEDFYKYVQKFFDLGKSNEIYDNYDKIVRKLVRVHKQYECDRLTKIENSRWL